jgi:hypothetical protein
MNDSPMPDALMHFFVFDVGVAVLFVFTLVRRSLCLESSSQDKIGRQHMRVSAVHILLL